MCVWRIPREPNKANSRCPRAAPRQPGTLADECLGGQDEALQAETKHGCSMRENLEFVGGDVSGARLDGDRAGGVWCSRLVPCRLLQAFETVEQCQ